VLSPVIYTQYKSKCRRRGLTFNLDKDYFIKLLKDNCAYCGNPPSNVLKASEYTGTALYNGIDRVDNSRGYEIDNVVACCETCNRAKLKMTKEEFLSWIDRVYRHQHDI
jgi:5-methylcytosine-specific restriction endonuclease McrA